MMLLQLHCFVLCKLRDRGHEPGASCSVIGRGMICSQLLDDAHDGG